MDTNARIAALLRDLAAVQTAKQSMWDTSALQRPCSISINRLSRPCKPMAQFEIPNVGPKSEPITIEVLQTGASPIVEKAISKGGLQPDINWRAVLRKNFPGRAQVVQALQNKKLKGPVLGDYNGDLPMPSVWSDGNQNFEVCLQSAAACFALFKQPAPASFATRVTAFRRSATARSWSGGGAPIGGDHDDDVRPP